MLHFIIRLWSGRTFVISEVYTGTFTIKSPGQPCMSFCPWKQWKHGPVCVCVYSQPGGGSCPSRRCWERSPGSPCSSWRLPPELELGSPSFGWSPLRIELPDCSRPSRGTLSHHGGSKKHQKRTCELKLCSKVSAAIDDRQTQSSGWHSQHMLHYSAILPPFAWG